MRYEVTEQISAPAVDAVLDATQQQLAKISRKCSREGSSVVASDIESTFGSINRTTRVVVTARSNGSKVLLVADVTYKPSFWFWIIFLITIFSWIGWLIPLGFYLYHKSMVRVAVTGALANAKRESEFLSPAAV